MHLKHVGLIPSPLWISSHGLGFFLLVRLNCIGLVLPPWWIYLGMSHVSRLMPLVYLVLCLHRGGYTLVRVGFPNSHALGTFGSTPLS